MSFRTERPFFPYREPASSAKGDQRERLLRIYLLSEHRFDGQIGNGGAWPGRTVWAGEVQAGDRSGLLSLLKLPGDATAVPWHLTEFEDRSSPRPGVDDLYFGLSSNQSTVERGVYGYVGFLILALVLLVLVGVFYLVFRILRSIVRAFRPAPASPSPRDPTTPPPSA